MISRTGAVAVALVGAAFLVARPARSPGDAPFIEAVYPTMDTLPENLLRFYVQFSRPMMRRESLERIALLDERGEVVSDVFLELAQELWSADDRRLTMLLDPGRIKRGLRPHRERGGPLASGHVYTLRIDAGWPDSSGAPTLASYEKRFIVREADREVLSPELWSISAPAPGARAPLEMRFGEPLDHALALQMIGLMDASDRRVDARVMLRDDDRVIQFVPDRPWVAGKYTVVVDQDLEDIAGNSTSRLFDSDLAQLRCAQCVGHSPRVTARGVIQRAVLIENIPALRRRTIP